MEFLKNELLNKEITLIELDNLIHKETNANDSLFNNIKLALENNSWTYNNKINIIWELIEQNENIFITIVKVVAIEQL